MDTSKILYDFFDSKIGKGKEFPTKMAMARFLSLSESDAAKLYKFLKGSDTQYRSIVDWYGRLGGRLLMPEDTGPYPTNLPALIPPDDATQCDPLDRIAQLEQQLAEKDQQLAELIQYKHRWEGLVDIRKMEAEVKVRAQQTEFKAQQMKEQFEELKKKQENQLFSIDNPLYSQPENCTSEQERTVDPSFEGPGDSVEG